MAIEDLHGKTVYSIETKDFEELFCLICNEYQTCPKDEEKMSSCRLLVDSGIWDKHYRDR
jgi:hypothetical protein